VLRTRLGLPAESTVTQPATNQLFNVEPPASTNSPPSTNAVAPPVP